LGFITGSIIDKGVGMQPVLRLHLIAKSVVRRVLENPPAKCSLKLTYKFVTRNTVTSVRTHDSCANSDRQEEFGKMKVLCWQVYHDELRRRLSSCSVAQQATQ